MTIAEYVKENEARKKKLFAPYDPELGVGSKCPRFPLQLSESTTVHLPENMSGESIVEMIGTAGSLEALVADKKLDWDKTLRDFNYLRTGYDFEFWACRAATIKDKKTARMVPFVLNPPQRGLTWEFEQVRWQNRPVRQLVLKHRQWGCTTLCYTYIQWHQIRLYKNRDAWFIGIDKDGSEDVVQRYRVTLKDYPYDTLTFKRFGRSLSARWIPERNCVINIGTVEKPNAPSGRTPQYAHLFEVGKWPSHQSVNAENVVQNVESMVHDYPGNVMILESTAKADTGTYFKKLCNLAERGQTSYRFFFAGWTTDSELVREIPCRPKEFVENWDKYDEFLWDSGATFEQIAWHQNQRIKPGYVTRDYSIKEEYPTNPREAFQTGAKRVFPEMYVHAMKREVMKPRLVGELYADGAEGREALQGVVFEEESLGRLKIWRLPGYDYEGQVPEHVRITNRYLLAADVGGASKGADFSDCAVLDRAPILFGDLPEIVAEWHGHIDPDLFAWVIARLGVFYQKGEVVAESNKWEQTPFVDETNFIAPDSSITVLDRLVEVYPNLYMRQVHDARTDKLSSRAGFHMNEQTKDMIVSAYKRAMRQFYEGTGGYRERDELACEEADYYMYIQKASRTVMAAAAGHNDDTVTTRGLLAWRNETAYPPRIVTSEPKTRKRPASLAKF